VKVRGRRFGVFREFGVYHFTRGIRKIWGTTIVAKLGAEHGGQSSDIGDAALFE
jgi:hypothetical protein